MKRMKKQRMFTLIGMTAFAVFVLVACPTDGGGGGTESPYITTPANRAAHLAMLQKLGVDVTPDLPRAPNGDAYDPIPVSSGGRSALGAGQTLGPLGKVFSIPKREIFAAGYPVADGVNHGLYEDLSDAKTLRLLDSDTANTSGWDSLNWPRKSAAADLDGDGIDEVVTVTLNRTNDKLFISKGVYNNGAFTVTTAVAPFDAPSPNALPDSSDYYLPYTAWNIIAADLNGDGKQECVFTYPGGYMYVLDNSLRPNLVRTGDAEGLGYYKVAAADYDQDGKDEICLMRNPGDVSANAQYVILDDQDAGFAELDQGVIGTSIIIRSGNVDTGDFDGDGLPDTVFFGRNNNDNANTKVLLLLKTTLGSGFTPRFNWVTSATKTFDFRSGYWKAGNLFPRIAAGDVDGDRKADAAVDNSLWTLNSANQFVRVSGTGDITDGAMVGYYDCYDIVMGDVTGDRKDDVVVFSLWEMIKVYYHSGSGYQASTLTDPNLSSNYETGCLPNVDKDSFILRDTGARELLFTDPQVVAILASPPYYEGINEDGDGGTSFGYSTSSGTSSSNTFGFSVGASVGFEFSLFGSGAEFEASVNTSYGWTQSEAIEITESWGWNGPLAEDTVIFTAIPFDVYYYTVVSAPSDSDAEPGDTVTVSIPRKLEHYHMPLPLYNAGVPSEQQIAVSHTLGRPQTYFTPVQRDAEKTAAGSKGLFSTTTMMTAGAGMGSTTINIERVNTADSSFSFDLEIGIAAKVKAGGATVGASAGFNYGYETTTSVSEGTWIEGTVPAIPADSYEASMDFRWGLMAYPKKYFDKEYVFVTYWVE